MIDDPSYSVVLFLLALFNAVVAQKKGRSGGSWFVLSLFLGPIATFCLVVSKNRNRTVVPAMPPQVAPPAPPPRAVAPPVTPPLQGRTPPPYDEPPLAPIDDRRW